MNPEPRESWDEGECPTTHAHTLHFETKKSVSGIAANLIAKAGAFGFGLVFQIAIARKLGPERLGQFALALSVLMFISVITGMGLDNALSRVLPAHAHKPYFARIAGAHFSLTIRQVVWAAALGMTAVIVFRDALSGIVSPNHSIAGLLLALSPLLILTPLNLQMAAVVRAWERYQLYAFLNDFLPRFLTGAIFVALAWTLGNPVLAYAAGLLGAPIIQAVAVSHSLGEHFWRWKDRDGRPMLRRAETAQEMRLFGLKTMWYVFLVSGTSQVARLILGVYGLTAAVGIYVIAESLSAILVYVQGSFSTVFLPQVAKYSFHEQDELLAQMYGRLSRWSVLVVAPFVALMFFDSHEIVGMYGSDYSSGATVLRILICAQFSSVALGLNGNLLYMSGRENVILLGQMASLACAVVGAAALIPHMGMVGVAVAVGTSSVALNVTLAYVVKRTFHFETRWRESRSLMTLIVMVAISAAVVSRLFSVDSKVLSVVCKLAITYALLPILVLLLDRRREDEEFVAMAVSTAKRLWRR